MSYIVKSENPFINFKLTEKGREKLALGALTFSYWSVGDSEINYKREYELDNGLSIDNTSAVFRPADRQPDIKYYVSTSDTVLKPLTGTRTVKTLVNNKADEKGFFSGSTDNFFTLNTPDYTKSSGTVLGTSMDGGNIITISGVTEGDFILFKLNNQIIGDYTDITSNDKTVPYLWYKAVSVTGDDVTLDRDLSDMSGVFNIPYFVYGNGDLSNDLPSNSAKWDQGSLTFYLDGLEDNYPTWRMNNIWEENISGLSGINSIDYRKFGSHNYLGSKNYFGYSIDETDTVETLSNLCDGSTSVDTANKAISVIHFTNNSITNQYGEFLYINEADDKIFRLDSPTLMYHRRTVPNLGMSFISSGDTKKITDTNIEYFDLVEDPLLVTDKPVKAIGKVFPQLKTAVIHDEEILTALSYKSNRNWTLPSLEGKLKSPEAGSNGGVLEPNKTIYITYSLDNESGSGINKTLPCQKYAKISNNTATSKDIEFIIEDIGLLRYMNKIESVSYSGEGFYADSFKLLYQIVDSYNERPLTDKWIEADFTSEDITGLIGESISPSMLERQNATLNGFILTKSIHLANINNILDITSYLNIPLLNDTEQFSFGCENIFYGNINTYIGASIFKTIFNINLPIGDYNTTNPTKDGIDTNIKITEIGIYDSTQSLIGIAKMSEGIEIGDNPVTIEVAMDF